MLYVIRRTESGGFVVTDKEPSTGKGLLKGAFRFPGNRYSVPSIIRLAEQTGDPEVFDLAHELVQSLQPGDPVTFAIPTMERVQITRDTSGNILPEPIEINRCWADIDMDKLELALEKYAKVVDQVS